MKATVVLEVEVKDDKEIAELMRSIAIDNRIIKGNAYDRGQKDHLPESEARFALLFTRHIHTVGGRNYGG